MAYRVRWTRPALEDLAAIREYVSRDSPVYAARFAEQLQNTIGNLQRMPMRGRVVPELGQFDIREIFIGRYRVIFRITETTVQILNLLHGSRDFASEEPKREKTDERLDP